VTSVVGLERARLFHFANGGAEELFLGRADMMQRNLVRRDRRVEVLFIKAPDLRARARDIIFRTSLADTAKCWQAAGWFL
jgi:polyphosphate kinase